MKIKKYLVLVFFMALFLIPNKVWGLNEVNIYFFYSDECNICSQEKAYLEALKERYFNIRVYSYAIASDANYNLMKQAKELYNVNESGVPFTVIGDTPFIGFSQSKKCNMEKKIYEYSYNNYENKFGTKLLTIGYRTDLTGDVKNYYEDSNYVIEENGTTNTTTNQTKTETSIWSDPKYKASIILVSGGLIIGIIVLIITLIERKRRIW